MYVRTEAEDGHVRKNGIDVRQLYPWDGVVTPPWNSTFCTVRPHESSTEHAHATDETFIFTAGSGTVRVGDELRPVTQGDVIYIPHGNAHVVTNTSDDAPLTFVSVYWLQPTASEEPARG
ncbi:cupin domain-containing protein [Streptomyces albireticuli]|uniref:Cupin n=1 Tax=Streptomyces albireticuli TaxID=1940 RepID=A0A2A2DHC7_9ACTN|nr:cupin domain-containing protein [Streptomyces albireticuli]MCD9142789.1 cupin domain-containing protein [Streptomyces albireticuli]MCD9162892.1 cupin domain-containing protein [Streptomyces albireticuli]MCD9192452.1 cupin domain-containing protein [Streptomyces albireticuli]PAU50867.1 cupin [Streptomyces albireticuli]